MLGALTLPVAACAVRTAQVRAELDLTAAVRRDFRVAITHGSANAALFHRNVVALSQRVLAALGVPLADLEQTTHVLLVQSDTVTVNYEENVPVVAGSTMQHETGDGSSRMVNSTTYRTEKEARTSTRRLIWFALFDASYLNSLANTQQPVDQERAIWRCSVNAAPEDADADLERVLRAGLQYFLRSFSGKVYLDYL